MNEKNRLDKKLTSHTGVTMLELLIVVGIIAILSAVVFINVVRYQRNLNQLERDGIAKEIFVAAQNHLTVAVGENYGNISEFGKQIRKDTGDNSDNSDIYQIIYSADSFSVNDTSILDLMLPLGSIDETVRTSGSYIITYQKKTGLVQDVFYTSVNGSPEKFNHTLTAADYQALMTGYTGDENRKDRRKCNVGGGSYVLGWYGGAKAAELSQITLRAPSIEVNNGNTLTVTVKDSNFGDTNVKDKYTLKLYITGKDSGAKKIIELDVNAVAPNTSNPRVSKDASGNYVVVLDDITKRGMHFTDLVSDNNKKFYWGEDIEIQTVAAAKNALATEAKSDIKTTNSLFDEVTGVGAEKTASINNFRHLENLDKNVSSNSNIESIISDSQKAVPQKAKQTSDLNWIDFDNFITVTNGAIYIIDDRTAGYRPVEINNIEYDGDGHKVSNLSVTDSKVKQAGMFGEVAGGGIRNLEIVDFNITEDVSSNNAGALAAYTRRTVVENVVVYNSTKDPSITATQNAGGLIGLMEGGSVTGCGAAVIVGDSVIIPESAGGLIGKAKSFTDESITNGQPTITASYSGGHTNNGSYSDTVFNVTGNVAGGLVGIAENTTVIYSYSTCSVDGKTVSKKSDTGDTVTISGIGGGFIGRASSAQVQITNSYCTGLVSGDGDNAFLGEGSLHTGSTKNHYYEIVNKVIEKNNTGIITDISYKGPGDSSATPFDRDADTLNDFMPSIQKSSRAYDTSLVKTYQGKYNLPTVAQLIPTNDQLINGVSSFTASNTHYGDWPSPEALFLNEKNPSGS